METASGGVIFGFDVGGRVFWGRTGQVPSRPSAMDVDEARRLYDSGLSFAQVGQRMGYSATWLARCFKAAGIPVRPSGRPLTTPAPDVDLEELVLRRDAG